MKRSLFRKYFLTSAMCVVSSLVVLAAVFFICATRFFERDKYELLGRNASIAVTVTSSNYQSNDRRTLNKETIALSYAILSNSTGADFLLFNLDGGLIYHSGSMAAESEVETANLPADLVARALEDGFETTGILPGIYDQPRYMVLLPVSAGDFPFGILLVNSPANDLMIFLREITQMFLLSTAVVLIVASLLIFVLSTRMVRPLRQMLEAIQSFAKGDFSKRVPVASYDELGQLSMAFNNMASTLASTESSRRSFVANVSHELKTPMTTIGGFVDGILDGTIPPEKHDHYLQVVSSEIRRLSRLVRSMLDTSRIEAGELEKRPVVFDISEIIRQTFFTFERAIEEKQLEVRGLDIDHVIVYADVDLMHQVVYNLIENAVKFVNAGGYISFAYRSDDDFTYVAIRNSGQGINKEEAPQLFERFYKADRSRSTNKSGVGLGLHIVRSIVSFHGGEVVVRSVEGEYTEFEFSIPNPKSVEKPEKTEGKWGKGEREKDKGEDKRRKEQEIIPPEPPKTV